MYSDMSNQQNTADKNYIWTYKYTYELRYVHTLAFLKLCHIYVHIYVRYLHKLAFLKFYHIWNILYMYG